MYLQFSIRLIGIIMYCPKTNWPILFCLVWWYVICTTKSAAARVTIHGSASSTYVSCGFQEHTIFPITWCIIYMVEFACEFPEEVGFVLIPCSCYINLLLNVCSRNSPPWSYTISTGRGYQTSDVVSTKFAIVVAFLSLYYVFSDHLVAGYIIVKYFKIRGSLPFLHIL